MSETEFKFKTRYDTRPKDESKVYFSCHPDDFDKYFEFVYKELFEVQKCAIFYTGDMNAEINDENLLITLERMSLFVIPVTRKLLTTKNRTMSFDLEFAKEKHIPILPLVMENDIYDIYKRADKFGDMQYLKPFNKDRTAIGFKDKLIKFLDLILFDPALIEAIRAAFDTYIFLSYRKKDRRYANDLMKLIHSDSDLEDVAIWFDEFLTPGESFVEDIAMALNESELFTLVVSPKLVERQSDGTQNFIMREEYPVARDMGKTILPAEVELTDKDKLNEEFPGLPECSDIKDKDAFFKRLKISLGDLVTPDNNDDPEHNYLIGLAYLKGIDVEIDTGRGVRMITKSANSGYPPAMKKIYEMYRDGDGVAADHHEALRWVEKLYKKCCTELGEDDDTTLDVLQYLVNSYEAVLDYRNNLKYSQKLYDLLKTKLKPTDSYLIETLKRLAFAYRKSDTQKQLALSKECFRLCADAFGKDDEATIDAMGHLACAYKDCRLYKESLELFKECHLRQVQLLGEKHPETLTTLNNMASVCVDLKEYSESIKFFKFCYDCRKADLGEDDEETIDVLCNLATAYEFSGDIKKAIKLYEKGYDLFCKKIGKENPRTLKTLNRLSIAYFKIGNYRESIRLCEICYKDRLRSLGETADDTLESLDNLSYVYGKYGDLAKSIELLMKYHSICKNTFGPYDERTKTSYEKLRRMLPPSSFL